MARQPLSEHTDPGDADIALRFVDSMTTLLGLPRHFIDIPDVTACKGAIAEIEHDQQRYYAAVYLGRGWKHRTDLEKMHALTHEVCHMMHRRVETSVRRFEDHLQYHEWPAMWREVMVEMELMTDMWANALCHSDEVKELWETAKKQPDA